MAVKQSVPIVFIHKGRPSYLACALWQAKRTNPKSNIFLINDKPFPLSFINHIPIKNYLDEAKAFAKVYIHLSSNPLPFERFCFERWFILRKFMKNKQLNSVVYADSDLLIYKDLTPEFDVIANHFMAIGQSSSFSGHLSLIPSIESLDFICDFFMKIYTNNEDIDYLKRFYKRHSEQYGPGGFCDMTALGMISWEGHQKYFELNTIRDGSIFDQALSDGRTAEDMKNNNGIPSFEIINGIKQIHIKEGKRCFYHKISRKFIWANTIHFQGGSKTYMYDNTEGKDLNFKSIYYYLRLLEKLATWSDSLKVIAKHVIGGLSKRLGIRKTHITNQ